MELLGGIFNAVLDPIFDLFKVPMFAPFLAMVISLAGLFLVGIFFFDFRKKRAQIKSFSEAFAAFESASDFAKNYHLIQQRTSDRPIFLKVAKQGLTRRIEHPTGVWRPPSDVRSTKRFWGLAGANTGGNGSKTTSYV